MKSQVEEYVKRSKRYQNIDGTAEMGMGLMMLAFALLAYLQYIVPKSSIFGHGFGGFAFMYVILVPILGLGWWSVKAIKRRITYLRTGYVAYRRDLKVRVPWAALSAGIAVAVVLVFRLARQHDAMSLFRFMYAATFVALYVFTILRTSREHTWKWRIAVFMAIGLSAISLKVPGGMAEWFRPASLFLGLTWLASGTITLILYVRRTRPPAVEAD
jgi:hypothetical protein